MTNKKTNNIENKIKEILAPIGAFVFADMIPYCDQNSTGYYLHTFQKWLIIKPLNIQAEKKLKIESNRLLISNKHFFCLKHFPEDVYYYADNKVYWNKSNIEKMPPKYRSRIEHLQQAQNMGNIEILTALELPTDEFLALKYKHKECSNRKEDKDFKDDQEDTQVLALTKINTSNNFKINSINHASNTLILLHNAKQYGNTSLIRQYKGNINAFYTDCILYWLLNKADVIEPELCKYNLSIYSFEIPVKELKKLYPNRNFRLSKHLPSTVKLEIRKADRRATYNPPTKQYISPNDMVIITFSPEYLTKFNNILSKENDLEDTWQFYTFPLWWILQFRNTLNSTQGFNFMLYIISLFRMKKPQLCSKGTTIMHDTGIDKYSIPLLNKCMQYLHDSNMLDCKEPIVFSRKTAKDKENNDNNTIDIKDVPTINGYKINLTKPRKTKPKKKK